MNCPTCGPITARLERMPEGSPHFARRTCPACNRFLGWAPWPRDAAEGDASRLFDAMVLARRRGDHRAIRGLQAGLRRHGWEVRAIAPAGAKGGAR